MIKSIHVAFVALALTLAPRSGRAEEPSGGAPSLDSIARLREAGDLTGAATQAAALVHAPGASLEAHVAYQDLMRDLGKEAALEAEYRARARSEGAGADDLYLLGRLVRGAKAVAQFRAALRADPAHFPSLCGLGNAALEAGDVRSAERAFGDARALRPESGLAWNGTGRVAEAKGERASAEAAYRKAIEFAPKLVVARVNLAVLLVGAGRTRQAQDVLDEAVKVAPRDPLPLVARGAALLREGREEEASKAFKDALAVDGKSVATLTMLAGTYVNLNKLELAEKAVADALALAPRSVTVRVGEASLLFAKGDGAGALAAAEKALQLDGDCAAAQFLCARSLERLGESRKAESAFRRAVKADETNAVFVRGLAQFLAREGRWKDAVGSFHRVVELTNASSQSLYDLGLAQLGANEPKKSADTFERLLAAQPDFTEAWLKLGIVCRDRLRDSKRALRAFRSYVQNGGKDARVKNWIAELEKTAK
jgi:Tfp pilus assembly protein PilF